LKPTRAGWVFFAFTLGVGFAALNTGNNLLYLVFSLMLAFLVLSGVLSESALRGIEVTRRLPRELHAGSANPVRLELHNNQRRVAAFAIVVEDRVAVPARAGRERVSQSAGRVFTLRIGPGETLPSRYSLTPDTRGLLEFAPVLISTRFPFGLFVKTRVLDLGGSALIYPALLDALPRPPDDGMRREGEFHPIASADGSSVDGVRAFQPGDPVRRVHWRTSLRRRALLVLQQEDERDAEVEIELATHASRWQPGASRDDFEQRVSLAASEVVANLAAGLRVGLRTESEQIPAASGGRQRARLLSFLARVEAQKPAA